MTKFRGLLFGTPCICITVAVVDVNECSTTATNKCSSNSTCRNTAGSYQCECLPGFQLLNDRRTCTGRTTDYVFFIVLLMTVGFHCYSNCQNKAIVSVQLKTAEIVKT